MAWVERNLFIRIFRGEYGGEWFYTINKVEAGPFRSFYAARDAMYAELQSDEEGWGF